MTTTDTIAIITTQDRRKYFCFLNGSTDGTETEIKIYDLAGATISVGEHLNGQTITRIEVMCSAGSILGTLRLYAKSGGRVLAAVGCERTSNQRANLDIKNLNIPIETGMLMKVNTTD